MVTRGCVWSPETVDGYQWFLWLSVVTSGFLWLPEAVCGHQGLYRWLPVVFMVIW